MGNGKNTDFAEYLLEKIRTLDTIRVDDLPDIELYMDQVIKFMDDHLDSIKRYDGDKLLTKSMINNYSKNKLLPSPTKKKYSKDHLILLVFIYYFKNVLSIKDISSLTTPLSDNFFDGRDEKKLTEIYEEIFKMCEIEMPSITKSILGKYKRVKKGFSDIEDEEKRRYLTDFAFISTLCFDIYIKKMIIEGMIDCGKTNLNESKGKK